VPLTPGPDFKGRSGAGAYGDFVEELDWSVGEIVRALAETGVLEQTLIIFTSDNGGRLDPSALGRGHRANGIYLGQKTDVWEGGIRIPLIMQWPGVIRAGQVSDTPVMLTDLLPTFMEIAKTPAPEGWSGDGASLLALLKGQPASGGIPDRTLAFNWGNRSLTFAVRRGEWLYIDRQGSGGVAVGGEPGKAQASHYLTYAQAGFENSDILPDGTIKSDAPKEQLYNLQTDPAQKTNVVRQFPEKAAALREALDALRQPFARRTPPAKPILNDEHAK
jgi:arylsulfatase A-like enzyme